MKAIYSHNTCLNFMPHNGGELERVAARQNAVVVSFFVDADEDGEYLRHSVWVECIDSELQEQLLEKARKILAALKEK